MSGEGWEAVDAVARRLVDAGRLSEAEALLREEIASGTDELLLVLADLLSERPARGGEAERLYRRAIAAGIVEAHNDLGVWLVGADRRDEAEAEFRAGLAEGDDLPLRNLGKLLADTGRDAEAEEQFRLDEEAGR